MWLASWLVRFGISLNLERYAKFLLKFSYLFDRFGSDAGGMHMILKGESPEGKNITIKWYVIAKDNDGPNIPTFPAVLLARKIMLGKQSLRVRFLVYRL